jgi:hypothetical protein
VSTLIAGHWLSSNRRDPRAVALYLRHYSAGRNGKRETCYTSGFTGPGEDMVLLTERCDALFVWSRCIRNDGQTGINCAVFRNESDTLSSELIREADDLAWDRWPDEARHFTYVDPSKVRRKRDPGRCFIKADWHPTGHTSTRGLIVLERVR